MLKVLLSLELLGESEEFPLVLDALPGCELFENVVLKTIRYRLLNLFTVKKPKILVVQLFKL